MKAKKLNVSLADIQDAKQVIQKYLSPTPLLQNPWLSEMLGCQVYLKLENMQPIGSFKIRGATFRISQLTPAERKCGVIAASAGNHAQGVAWASKKLGVSAVIVMPKGAPLVKIQNTRALGAEVILAGDNYEEAVAHAKEQARKTKRVLIPAFEDSRIIAGQGTIGLEILDQLPDVDYVLGSIGGGGMMAGIALSVKALHPSAKIIGCQATGAPAMIRSISKGKALSLPGSHTFADGISVANASPQMLAMLKSRISAVGEASDEEIAAAVLMLLEKARIVVEGAGALPLAVLSKIHGKLRGKKVVLVVSGGNIDVNLISKIIDRGLICAGRRLRINVLISDRPGSLARLTDVIARHGANVMQAIHDRSENSMALDRTDVELMLETRGPDHSADVIHALEKIAIRVEPIY